MFVTVLLLCILAFAVASFLLYFNTMREYFKKTLIGLGHFFANVWLLLLKLGALILTAFVGIWGLLKKLFHAMFTKHEKHKPSTKDDTEKNTEIKQDSSRVSQQFHNSRPVLLPPEENNLTQQESLKALENEDKSIAEPKDTSAKKSSSQEVSTLTAFEQETANREEVFNKMREALREEAEKENQIKTENSKKEEVMHEEKKPTLPSLQYRFSNKSFKKNQEVEEKSQSLQDELEEIIKNAQRERREQAENTRKNNSETKLPENNSEFKHFDSSSKPNPADSFAPKSSKTPLSTSFSFRAPQKPKETPKEQDKTDPRNISVNDFDLNALPEPLKRQIILKLFGDKR